MTHAAGRLRRSLALAAAVMIACSWALLGAAIWPSRASAAVVRTQVGSYVNKTAVTSITPTLPAASASGDLLVALIDTAGNTTVTAPSGWAEAIGAYTSAVGTTQIWYRANNPGGVTSVTFNLSASDTVTAQLSEWSGVALVAPLNGTGTGTRTSNNTTLTVSATAAAPNELAITSFATSTAGSGNTFTPASGWTNLLAAASVSDTGDYKLSAGSGTVSELETAGTTAKWVGAIATFYGSCGGGSLSLTPPGTVSFSGLTLNGTSQSTTANAAFTPTDATGTGSGWNLTGTSTTFTNTGGKALPTTATTVTAASAASTAATCLLPTNAIGYPVTLPAGSTPPTAAKLYDASAATGLGGSTVTLTFKLTTPAGTYNGTFSSTWTFTIASGP